jgi:hypothetical protein
MTGPENGGAPTAEGANAGEEEAWADVTRAWLDEERHRAYLDRFGDLDGLAVAGRRYRDVLLARPDDPVALRFREEILRRAAAKWLTALPRTEAASGRGRRAALVAAIALAVVLAAFAARALVAILGARP